jgi:hypothetical protein
MALLNTFLLSHTSSMIKRLDYPVPHKTLYHTSLHCTSTSKLKMAPDHYHFMGTPVTTLAVHKADHDNVANDVPPRFELFLLGDGEKKVTWAPETRKLPSLPPSNLPFSDGVTLQVSPTQQSSPSTRKTTPSPTSSVPNSQSHPTSCSPPTKSLTLCSQPLNCVSRPMDHSHPKTQSSELVET